MGVDTRAIVGIGITFDAARFGTEWFVENFKGTLTARESRLVGESLSELIDAGTREDFPEWVCLNCYSGEGFALYYPLKAKSAEELREAVDVAIAAWGKYFKEAPRFISDVQWW